MRCCYYASGRGTYPNIRKHQKPLPHKNSATQCRCLIRSTCKLVELLRLSKLQLESVSKLAISHCTENIDIDRLQVSPRCRSSSPLRFPQRANSKPTPPTGISRPSKRLLLPRAGKSPLHILSKNSRPDGHQAPECLTQKQSD